jgi:hypothetical protein
MPCPDLLQHSPRRAACQYIEPLACRKPCRPTFSGVPRKVAYAWHGPRCESSEPDALSNAATAGDGGEQALHTAPALLQDSLLSAPPAPILLSHRHCPRTPARLSAPADPKLLLRLRSRCASAGHCVSTSASLFASCPSIPHSGSSSVLMRPHSGSSSVLILPAACFVQVFDKRLSSGRFPRPAVLHHPRKRKRDGNRGLLL